MKHIACCSFGKDSLAQIIVGKEHGEPIDAAIYSEVMFTKEISGEFPEHRDFIYNIAIPKLKSRYGVETIVLRSERTMWDDFHTVRVRGSTAGLLRGFPIPGFCNINRDCKIPPIRKYLYEQTDDVIQYVGIAADASFVQTLVLGSFDIYISIIPIYGPSFVSYKTRQILAVDVLLEQTRYTIMKRSFEKKSGCVLNTLWRIVFYTSMAWMIYLSILEPVFYDTRPLVGEEMLYCMTIYSLFAKKASHIMALKKKGVQEKSWALFFCILKGAEKYGRHT